MAVSAAARAMSPEDGLSIGSTIGAVRRYRWVVLAIVSLALLGGFISTALTPTTYVGRTSLIVSSADRSPQQDAVLVQGYVAYFDDRPYQRRLLAEAGLDSSLTVAAEAAAASPIVVISATTEDSASAQSAAIRLATVFKDDINLIHNQRTATNLANLQDQLDTALGRNGRGDQALIGPLQEQIRELQADRDDVLQELQSRGGVTAQPPSLLVNVGLSLAGGVLLGALAALTLAALSPRLWSGRDVANRVGLNTLVELPAPGTRDASRLREQRLRQLTNVLRAQLAGPGVVAVTQATNGTGTRLVSLGLATEWATQGHPTVLLRFGAGEPPSADSDQAALAPLEPAEAVSLMRPGPVAGMSILDLSPGLAGGLRRLPLNKVPELLQLEPLVSAFVILEAPDVVGSAEAQAAALAGNATVLVIDAQVDLVPETREAVRVLRQSRVPLRGAVLSPMSDEQARDGQPEQGSTARQPRRLEETRAAAASGRGRPRGRGFNGPAPAVKSGSSPAGS